MQTLVEDLFLFNIKTIFMKTIREIKIKNILQKIL